MHLADRKAKVKKQLPVGLACPKSRGGFARYEEEEGRERAAVHMPS
jgi:hypothetical protein